MAKLFVARLQQPATKAFLPRIWAENRLARMELSA